MGGWGDDEAVPEGRAKQAQGRGRGSAVSGGSGVSSSQVFPKESSAALSGLPHPADPDPDPGPSTQPRSPPLPTAACPPPPPSPTPPPPPPAPAPPHPLRTLSRGEPTHPQLRSAQRRRQSHPSPTRPHIEPPSRLIRSISSDRASGGEKRAGSKEATPEAKKARSKTPDDPMDTAAKAVSTFPLILLLHSRDAESWLEGAEKRKAATPERTAKKAAVAAVAANDGGSFDVVKKTSANESFTSTPKFVKTLKSEVGFYISFPNPYYA